MAASDGTLQALLDELQRAEEAGAEALGLWLVACDDPRLRGGLRVIRARDLAHARLARRRLAALGADASHGTPRRAQSLWGVLAAPDVSNRSKLAILLARFPTRDDDPLPAVVTALEDDETRGLLETIHEDDRASLRWLREVADLATLTAPVPEPMAPTLLGFLDAFRAAEAASAEVLGAWCRACTLPGLRGGLETLAEREATHAALVAERLAELGGSARSLVDDTVLRAACDCYGSPVVSDEEKLGRIARRYPDDEEATRAVQQMVATPAIDPETREMLKLIAAGEAASFSWLRAYRRALAEHPREVSLRLLDGGR